MSVGESAVRYARECVRAEVLGGEPCDAPGDPAFSEKRGVFVTLNTFPLGTLRGCIGYPYPVLTLGEALRGAAESACHDPRFNDLSPRELGSITVEVTILTEPEPMPYGTEEELVGGISIGRDGLIIECMGRRGLLLPQVPVEWGWDAATFLSHLSMKAGLPPDSWKRGDAVISRFSGEVFSEDSPGGEPSKREFRWISTRSSRAARSSTARSDTPRWASSTAGSPLSGSSSPEGTGGSTSERAGSCSPGSWTPMCISAIPA